MANPQLDDEENNATLEQSADEAPADSDSAEASPDPAGVGSVAPQSNAATGNTTAGVDPKQYIMQKYGLMSDSPSVDAYDKAADDSKLKAAKDTALDNKQTAGDFANLFGIFGGANDANRNARLEQFDKGQDQSVANAQSEQQQTIKNYLTGRGLVKDDAAATQLAKDNTFKNTENQRTMDQQTQQDDANSDQSKALRDTIRQLAPQIANQPSFDQASYSQLSKVYPQLIQSYEAQQGRIEAARLRSQQGDIARQSHQDLLDQAAKAKQDAADLSEARKQFETLRKAGSDQTQSGRSPLGTAVNKQNSAMRVMSFADVTPDEVDAAKTDPQAKAALTAKLDNLTPQQYADVVNGLMSTVAPGNGSMSQFDHLRASTGDQQLANLTQYFTSNPAAANAGSLIENNLQSLNNEIKASQAVINKHHSQLRAGSPMAFRNPATAADAEAYLNAISDQAAKQSAAPQQAAQDPDSVKYAAMHNMPYAAADKIVQARKAAAAGGK